MKKLSLNLDTLAVETFETADGPDLRGTVHAHVTWQYNGCTAAQPCNPSSSPDYTEEYSCDDYSCNYSCNVSCGGTCYESCNCPTRQNTCWETCQPTVPC